MVISVLGGLTIFFLHSILTVTGLMLLKKSLSNFENFESFNLISLIDAFSYKFFLGLLFYIMAFLISLIILHKYPLGVSVSIMMPLSLVMSIMLGYIFLDENISIQVLLGLSLILAGIFTIYYKNV